MFFWGREVDRQGGEVETAVGAFYIAYTESFVL